MFTRNRLTRPFRGCELASNVGKETKASPTKASPLSLVALMPLFSPSVQWQPHRLWLIWEPIPLGFLETFCLGYTGIYFACMAHICDFIISMSCHKIQTRFVQPLFVLGEVFLGVASCSQTWKCVKHKTPAVNTYLPAVLKSSIYKTPGFKENVHQDIRQRDRFNIPHRALRRFLN